MTNQQDAAADFDFARLQIDDAVARFELPWVAPGAHVFVRPAHESNRAYQTGLLNLAGRRQRLAAVAASGSVSADSARQDRDEDRRLYPLHIVTQWGGITNRAGVAVPFTRENATAFLRGLPDWIFDKLRVFCLRPESFLQAEELPPDAQELAGN